MTMTDFIVGFGCGLLLCLLLLVRRGPWRPLDKPECEGGCWRQSKRVGLVAHDSIRWLSFYRCAMCDCKWWRIYFYFLVPRRLREFVQRDEDVQRYGE
jgi:hypothetical protein